MKSGGPFLSAFYSKISAIYALKNRKNIDDIFPHAEENKLKKRNFKKISKK